MKKMFLFMLIVSASCFSQKGFNDFPGRKKPYSCNDIIVIDNELTGKLEKRLPDAFILSPINFSYVKKGDSEVRIMSFYIRDYSRAIGKGVFFKLSNGEILRYENEPLRSSYGSGNYSIFCNIIMDDELISKLKDNKIVQFSMSEINVDISERNSKNLYDLFNCMFKD